MLPIYSCQCSFDLFSLAFIDVVILDWQHFKQEFKISIKKVHSKLITNE